MHGALADKPVTLRLAEATKICPLEAVGVLVTFWGNVAAHAQNGSVGHLSDVTLEQWAHWRRKRGAFAAWLRAHHLDADGRVNEWDEYAGALEVRREQDRQRQAKRRVTSHGNPRDTPRDITQQSVPTRTDGDGDGTVRDGTKNNNSTSSACAIAETNFLNALPSDLQRQKWRQTFDAWKNGMNYDGGRAAHPDDIAVGLSEYLLARDTPDFQPAGVLSFVRNAEKRRTTNGHAKPNAKSWDNVA